MNNKIKIVLFVFFLVQSMNLWSQDSFEFATNKKRDALSFQLINNLILIPVEVNGIQLTFLLDTGASNTVIFSFEDIESIKLNESHFIKLRGMGNAEPIDAVRSENNKVKIGDAENNNQTIYVIFDGALSFSARLGVPVHGIIGYDFLKDFVVEINHVSKRMRFFLPEKYRKKNCRNCLEKDIIFDRNKPNISTTLNSDKEILVLIDSGSGDALWLFEDEEKNIHVPENAFEDYLGLGLSGNIYGKRSKLESYSIGEFQLNNINVAYPQTDFLKNVTILEDRVGSIGGEILKRFNLVIDYQNEYIRFKKNKFFNQPFHYNMSGLTLEHGDFSLIKVKKVHPVTALGVNRTASVKTVNAETTYVYQLEQVYVVVDIRKGSPADIAGMLVGDEILEVNNNPAFKMELQEINQLFYSKEGRTIQLLISRKGKEQKIQFALKDVK